MKVNSHFVKTERKRDLLAKKRSLHDFLKSYKIKNSTPIDLNTRVFWNNKITNELRTLFKSPIFIQKNKIISNYLLNKSGALLDIGVGYGKLEELIYKNKNIKLHGIDISDKAVKSLRRRFKGVFVVGNIFHLPFPSKTFNYVIALDVLEHIAAYKVFRALKEIYRVLKDDSVVIISVPINEHLDDLLKIGQNPNGHLRIYTTDVLKAELKIVGFEIVKIQHLYAFKDHYRLKSFLLRIVPFYKHEANLCIITATKK